MSTTDLWGGVRIPIIMVSGPVNSGKTLFGLTIDPNCRRPSAEVQPTTIHWDQEGSADSYAGALNFEHKDTRAAVAGGVHNQVHEPLPTDPRWVAILKSKADCNDSPAASLFRAWYLSLLAIPPGRYSIGIVDTFTPIQDGMVDWLRRHPEAFGRSVAEYTKASSMFLWPDVKSMLSHILATDCRTRFNTFLLNVHLKNEWEGGTKTGRKVAEGLDVLEKLATLHLELDRTAKDKSKEAPRVPTAIVKKERLVRFGASGEEDRPILPPRLPAATPDAIRKYIASPPDFGKLEVGERLPDQSMTEDEKKRMEAAIAENNRIAAESHLSALEMARRAAEQGRIPVVGSVAAPATPAPPAGPKPITQAQATELMGLLRQLFATGQEAKYWCSTHGCADPNLLTETEAMSVLSQLYAIKAQKQQAAVGQPAPVTVPTSTNGEHATAEQRDQIRRFTFTLYGDGDGAMAAQRAWLKEIGLGAVAGLTHAQAQARIVQLEAMLAARQQQQSTPADGDDIPF